MSPSTPGSFAGGLQGFTVTCQQCGSANMTRLDRKEYQCNHCGAVTVISDTDAEHLEQLLRQMMYHQTPVQTVPPVQTAPAMPGVPGERKDRVALVFSGVVIAVSVLGLLLVKARRPAPAVSSVDRYFAQTSVPSDQIAMSPLEWVPDGESKGSYNGFLYNRSIYAVTPPNYHMVLFRNGVKLDDVGGVTSLGTLEPGEHVPVSFQINNPEPDTRYEITPPTRVEKNIFEIAAPVVLEEPMLLRAPHLPNYYLVGYVQNTFKRPFSGEGMVMLYDRQGRIIGSGVGNTGDSDLNPGEKIKLSINAWLFDTRSEPGEVASYEYLLNMWFRNERQSVSEQDIVELGSATVPNRIVRVDHPDVRMMADSSSSE